MTAFTAAATAGRDRVDIALRIGRFGGVRIVETTNATERIEDWSRVRSPARARRRMKQGHRQNVRITEKPAAYQAGDTMYVHPEFARALKQRLARDVERDMEHSFLAGIVGARR
jgi:hypothetical protein